MSVEVAFQRATRQRLPSNREMGAWLTHALRKLKPDASLTVRLVDIEEGRELNARWRGKTGPTNVLSFPVSGLEAIAPGMLGDIVLCAPVLKAEASAQKKTIAAHTAHLLVHGALHLLGFDHSDDEQAARMEALERKLMAELQFPDPYAERETTS